MNKIFIQKIFKQKALVIVSIIAILTFGAAIYFYWQLLNLKADPQKIGRMEAQNLIKQVGQLILLPLDETPTIATVTDADALRNQPFFANAKNGDKVLIYPNFKKAILYDPENNIIVEVAPVSIGGPSQ